MLNASNPDLGGGTHLLKPIAHNRRAKPEPRHERQIGISALIANQPLASGLLQMRLDHAHDAPNLVSVTVQHGGQVLLRVVESEPSPLAEIGSLAGCLEMQPGLRVELVGRARVLDLGGGVVGREEVFDDSA